MTTTAAPYVLLSCAVSLDGYLDDAGDDRLLLSNAEDFDRVDAVRASCDAILVGATTIRRDDPRLLVRSAERRAARVDAGRAENPLKVTLSASGDLDPRARFFTAGDGQKIVYTASREVEQVAARLGAVATVLGAGDPVQLPGVLADLHARGVRRLMVEGGGSVHTQFLTAGLADELHLVLAPFFVGDAQAPRFVGTGRFANGAGDPLRLVENRELGDGRVLLRYRAAH